MTRITKGLRYDQMTFSSNQLRNFSHSIEPRKLHPAFRLAVSFAMQPTYFSYPSGLALAHWLASIGPKNFRLLLSRELRSPRIHVARKVRKVGSWFKVTSRSYLGERWIVFLAFCASPCLVSPRLVLSRLVPAPLNSSCPGYLFRSFLTVPVPIVHRCRFVKTPVTEFGKFLRESRFDL